jgi:hypothetical protein
MRQKALIIVGLLLAFAVFQSCSSSPEKGLLTRYFNAVALNDNATMSTMAVEPLQLEVMRWEIVSVSPEKIDPAGLPGFNRAELDLKKAVDAQVGPTMAASDDLENAKDQKDMARTAAAKAAAQKKIEEFQAKYDAENKKIQDLKKAYTDAKAAAMNEEETTKLSLGIRELASIRDLTGEVHSKIVEIKVTDKAGAVKNYRLATKLFVLKDESTNMKFPSHWIITKFEPVG